MHWTSQTQCVANTRPGKHPSVPTAVETTDINLLRHSTTQMIQAQLIRKAQQHTNIPFWETSKPTPHNSRDSHSECSRCSAASNKGNQQFATSDSTETGQTNSGCKAMGFRPLHWEPSPNYNRTVTECTGVLLSPRGLVEPTCTLGSDNHVSGTPVRIRKLHGVPLQSPPLMYVNALPYVHAQYAPT